MNLKVRSYLIDAARKNKIVFYGDLVKDCMPSISLDSNEGRAALKQILIDISKFEHKYKRHLLSSIAINVKNEHGNGFYVLADELGYGAKSKLKEEHWGFQEAGRVQKYWQDEDNYKKYAIVDGSDESELPTNHIAFFTIDELNFFIEWQYQPYDPTDPTHVLAKQMLMKTVWDKTIYLGKRIQERIPGFELDGRRYWSQRGWKIEDGENTQSAIFKPYTWVKLFRVGQKDKDIFFTFGIDAQPQAEAFVYKIDCQSTRDSKLNGTQLKIFEELNPISARWNQIPFKELVLMSWEQLIEKSADFVQRHLDEFDKIVETVWGNSQITAQGEQSENNNHNKLNKCLPPNRPGVLSYVVPSPIAERDHVDYDARLKEQKALGDAGENLVIEYEKQILLENNRSDLACQVIKVKDSCGYDIASYSISGQPKYIEVKTTTKDASSSFYLSENEVVFMKENEGPYSIYRLYNFNPVSNTADYYEITSDVQSQLKMKPTQFEVIFQPK